MANIKTIRKEGGSRVVALSNLIPPDWRYVEVHAVKSSDIAITIKFVKVG